MKRKLIAMLMAILLVFSGVPLNYAVTYKTATVVEVSGAVSILKAGGEKAFTPEVNTILEHGDRIITGKGASVALKISEDKYVKVGEKTYMSLSELMSEAESGGDSTNIKLFTGKVWASISKPLGKTDSFEIETPTAVMGAKGTKFFVKYVAARTPEERAAGSSELTVLEGRVSTTTRVEGEFNGIAGTDEQDVEIFTNANEALRLSPDLVSGISSKIESLIASGQKIEDLNIQDVVREVAQAQKIEAVDLDLFVLEIVAEDPTEFSPELLGTENLDQLIAQKLAQQQQEPEPEPENTDLGIIYDDNVNVDPTVVPKAPTPQSNPLVPSSTPAAPAAGVSGQTDSSTPTSTGGTTTTTGGGTTSSNTDSDKLAGGGGSTVTVSAPVITGVEIVDAVSGDGIGDHIIVKFDKAVKDSTYIASASPSLSSEGVLGSLITTAISYDTIPNYSNIADDNSIVFAINTTNKSVNTAPVSYFKIASSGMIQSVDGGTLTAYGSISVSDKIAPIVTASMISIADDATDKYIRLSFSEPVTSYSSNFWTNLRLSKASDTTYANSQVIGYEATQKSTAYFEALKFNYPTLKWIGDAALTSYANIRLKVNPSSPVTIADGSGNTRTITSDISLTSFVPDTANAKISDISITTNTAKTDYTVTVSLTDYLSAAVYSAIAANPSALVQGYFDNAEVDFTNLNYVYATTDGIKLSFNVHLSSGSLVQDDNFTLIYAVLYDNFGRQVTEANSSTMVYYKTYAYQSATDAWTVDTDAALAITSATIVDAESDDGIGDHLVLAFNRNVDDSTYNPTVGMSLVDTANPDGLGSLVTDALSEDTISGITNDADDNVIVLDLDTTDQVVNTLPVAELNITAAAMITSAEGLSLSTVSGFPVAEKIKPRLISSGIVLSGDATDKALTLSFSEPITSYSSNFWTNLRLSNASDTTYANSQVIGYEATTKSTASFEALRFNYPTLKWISDAALTGYEDIRLKVNPSSPVTITDSSGNTQTITSDISLTSFVPDTTNAKITDIAVTTNTAETDYTVTVSLSDYLSMEVYNELAANPAALVQGYFDNAEVDFTNLNYVYATTGGIELSFNVHLFSGSLVQDDTFMLAYAGLYDNFGRQVTEADSSTTGYIKTFAYQSDTDEWTVQTDKPTPTGLQLISASTIDAEGDDGIVDYIRLIFNMPIDDSKFVANNGITMESKGLLGDIDDSAIVSIMPASYTDVADDNVVYLKLDNSPSYISTNSGETGSLTIPAGTFENMLQSQNALISELETTDSAAPIINGLYIELSEDPTMTVITVNLSEQVSTTANDFFQSIGLSDSYSTAFDQTVKFDVTAGTAQNEMYRCVMTGVTTEMNEFLQANKAKPIPTYLHTSETFVLTDMYNNARNLGGFAISENYDSALAIVSASIVDADSDDGIGDHLVLTFNRNVDDSTYNPTVGMSLVDTDNPDYLGSLLTDALSQDTISGLTNDVNDNVIVLNLDTTGQIMNTLPIAVLSITAPDMIKSVDGISLSTASSFPVTEQIKPRLISSKLVLQGDSTDKVLSLSFSEPIYDYDTAFWSNIRFAPSSQTTYTSASPIYFAYEDSTGPDLNAKNLGYPTAMGMMNAITNNYDLTLKVNPDAEVPVMDYYGNIGTISGDISLVDVQGDTINATVKSVTVTTSTAGSSYHVSIMLSDYLDNDKFAEIAQSPSELILGQFSDATVSILNTTYNGTDPSAISLSFDINVDSGTLAQGDYFKIDYAALIDYTGFAVEDYYDSDYQTFRKYGYESATEDWSLLPVAVAGPQPTSVVTLDEVGNDGIVDHIMITFDTTVDDSSFVPSNGILLYSATGLGAVDDSQLITNLTGDYADVADDNIIYLSVNDNLPAGTYNSGSLGTMNFPADTIQNMDGNWNPETNQVAVADQAAPVITKIEWNNNGDVADKYLEFTFSEPITNDGSVLFGNIALSYQDSVVFGDALAVLSPVVEANGSNDVFTVSNLDYDVAALAASIQMDNSLGSYVSFDSDFVIDDASGNETSMADKILSTNKFTADTKPAEAVSVSIEDMESSVYHLKIGFSDYLDVSAAQDFASALSDRMFYRAVADENNLNHSYTFSNPGFNTQMPGDITFEADLNLVTPLSITDRIHVNLQDLTDINTANTVANYSDGSRTNFDVVYDDGWDINDLALKILLARTKDTDHNGKIDLIELVFNQDVDDSTFAATTLSIAPDADITLDGLLLVGSALCDSQTVSFDSADDNQVFFAVTEPDEVPNTGYRGTFSIADSGMLTSLSGSLLDSVTDMTLTDGARPVLVFTTVDLSLSGDNKNIALGFSEALDPNSEADVIIDNMSVLSDGLFSSDGPLTIPAGATATINGDVLRIDHFPLTDYLAEEPSFVSKLSKLLYADPQQGAGYDETTRIKFNDDIKLMSLNGESYGKSISSYPVEMEPFTYVNRTNQDSIFNVTVAQVDSQSIKITYNDYIETYNELNPATTTVAAVSVTVGNYGAEVKRDPDHRSIIVTFVDGTPTEGDKIYVDMVRNITNSYADDADGQPIYNASVYIRYLNDTWSVETP